MTAPDLAVGDLVELTIGPVAHGGHCVARLDGRVVFVRLGLPGERVRARITEARPGSFCRADVVEVMAPAPGRVDAPCVHFHPGGCGGCDFQHASGDLQRELKAAVVAEQLRRLAGLEVPVVVRPLPGGGFGWRTRVRWALDDEGRIGPRRYRSHRVEGIGPDAPCLIAAPGLTELAAVLDVPRGVRPARAPGAARPARGRRRGAVGGGSTGGASGGRRRSEPGPEVTLVAVGPDRLAVWAGEPAPTVLEEAAGRRFEVLADGFWQVHPAAADTLAAAVTRAVGDPGALDLAGLAAWDLYGGVGLFGAVLADIVGAEIPVVSVEGDLSASALAARNLADLPTASAVAGTVAEVLDDLSNPGVVVLDPPRSGAGPDLCRRIAARSPQVIVYVACDPAALGRDTAALQAAGYRLDTLEAFDCFPQTHHVECVARFVPA